MNSTQTQSGWDGPLLFFAFFLANLRATIFIYLYPDPSTVWSPAWLEIAFWVLLLLVIGSGLFRENRQDDYFSLWRLNWPLALFLLLAILSILWSIGHVATLYRSLELLLASLAAAYFGMRLRPEQWARALFWLGAMVFIFSAALALGAPPTGTMYWHPFDGAWRGVYWHRNHLASITAFLNIIYLCRAIQAVRKRDASGVLDILFYLLSLFILYRARSATGYILLMILHASVVGILIWLRWEQRLRKGHYLIILAVGVFIAILVAANLEFVFGLLGRDPTMTGRLGLWRNLIEVAARRPWLGHGFGAVWTFDSFRAEIQQLAGWTSPPLIADNGLLDIFLHLGITGVLLLSSVLVLLTIRALRFGMRQKTLPGFFPLLVLVYTLVGNISFSLLAETEVFVWFLIVGALFMATSAGDKALTS